MDIVVVDLANEVRFELAIMPSDEKLDLNVVVMIYHQTTLTTFETRKAKDQS